MKEKIMAWWNKLALWEKCERLRSKRTLITNCIVLILGIALTVAGLTGGFRYRVYPYRNPNGEIVSMGTFESIYDSQATYLTGNMYELLSDVAKIRAFNSAHARGDYEKAFSIRERVFGKPVKLTTAFLWDSMSDYLPIQGGTRVLYTRHELWFTVVTLFMFTGLSLATAAVGILYAVLSAVNIARKKEKSPRFGLIMPFALLSAAFVLSGLGAFRVGGFWIVAAVLTLLGLAAYYGMKIRFDGLPAWRTVYCGVAIMLAYTVLIAGINTLPFVHYPRFRFGESNREWSGLLLEPEMSALLLLYLALPAVVLGLGGDVFRRAIKMSNGDTNLRPLKIRALGLAVFSECIFVLHCAGIAIGGHQIGFPFIRFSPSWTVVALFALGLTFWVWTFEPDVVPHKTRYVLNRPQVETETGETETSETVENE